MVRVAHLFASCILIALSEASATTTCSESSATCSASSAEADTSILLQRPVHAHVVKNSVALEDEACVDLTGTYTATRAGGTSQWDANIQSNGCSGKIDNWEFAVAGDTINDSGGNKVGTITGTGMPSTITMKFDNGLSYTKKTCVDLTGKYASTHRDSGSTHITRKQITSKDCRGSIDGNWDFTVAGDTITGKGTTGTITATRAGDITIEFKNGYIYKLDACLDLHGAYKATHKASADDSQSVDKDIEVEQNHGKCTGIIKCAHTANWHFTVTGVTVFWVNGTKAGTITGAGEMSSGTMIEFDNGWIYKKQPEPCVDLSGTYRVTRGHHQWDQNIQSTSSKSTGCSGKIGDWDFTVAGDTINDSGGNKAGTITGTGMPSTITMKFDNGLSYTKKTCVDLTGKYVSTHSAGGNAHDKQITSTGCHGSIDGNWGFTVAGDTITGKGSTGTITGTHAGIDITIEFNNGYTYRLDACADLTGAYKGTHKAATDDSQSQHKDIEVNQENGKCTGVFKNPDWPFTVKGVTIYDKHGAKVGTITGTGKMSSGATMEFDDGWTYKKKVEASSKAM
jgi:hypothetical protein